jgi:hypothetical protein
MASIARLRVAFVRVGAWTHICLSFSFCTRA